MRQATLPRDDESPAATTGSADGVAGTATIDLGGEQTGALALDRGQLRLALRRDDGSVRYFSYDRS